MRRKLVKIHKKKPLFLKVVEKRRLHAKAIDVSNDDSVASVEDEQGSEIIVESGLSHFKETLNVTETV